MVINVQHSTLRFARNSTFNTQNSTFKLVINVHKAKQNGM